MFAKVPVLVFPQYKGSVVVDLLFIITSIVGFCNCSMFVVCYFISVLVLQSS